MFVIEREKSLLLGMFLLLGFINYEIGLCRFKLCFHRLS